MRFRRLRFLAPKARRHGVKPPSQFENPARNWDYIRHMHSPWALIALFVLQIIMLALIMVLFGYQREFSDYLNQRGQYAERARHEENQAVCDLIGQLRADPAGQLAHIAKRLHCKNGPLPRAESVPSQSSSVPITPTTSFFTSNPTPGSQAPTGGGSGALAAGNRPLGTKVPAPTSAPSRTTSPQATTPPARTSSSVPAGGGTSSPPPTSPQLCVPLTGLCVPL